MNDVSTLPHDFAGVMLDQGSSALSVNRYSLMVRAVVRMGVSRKAWGQGKAAQQTYRRKCSAFEISEILEENLDEDRIARTGQIFPRGGLRKKSTKKIFGWVHRFQGRTFTKPLLRQAVRNLMRAMPNMPRDPSKTYSTFVAQQAKRLGYLVRQAKRIKEWGLLHVHATHLDSFFFAWQIKLCWYNQGCFSPTEVLTECRCYGRFAN